MTSHTISPFYARLDQRWDSFRIVTSQDRSTQLSCSQLNLHENPITPPSGPY